MAIKKSIFIIFIITFFSPAAAFAQSLGSSPPAVGQRIIIADDEPTLEQSLAKKNPYSLNARQISYLVSALLLLGVAGAALLRLFLPSSKEELQKQIPVEELIEEPGTIRKEFNEN